MIQRIIDWLFPKPTDEELEELRMRRRGWRIVHSLTDRTDRFCIERWHPDTQIWLYHCAFEGSVEGAVKHAEKIFANRGVVKGT